jgi:hypothetical protein
MIIHPENLHGRLAVGRLLGLGQLDRARETSALCAHHYARGSSATLPAAEAGPDVVGMTKR